MAGNGPPPSENRRRRNKDEFEEHAVTVPADAGVHGPELPGDVEYGPQTIVWYETWRRAPQAGAFVGTDWQRLHMLAPLVDQYFREPSTKFLSEIRLNESLLGATHVDRMRGRIKIEQPKETTRAPSGVADMSEARRRRMTDAS
ncbi:phage terminase small subunit [Streptomyces sp. NPDC002666]